MDTNALEHPKQIGPYRIVDVIGEGGMGLVYEAEQKAPVRRRVALKTMKHGLDTREVVGRFEAERQALAVMSHPGIAKVFDAGVTEDARPYFVMELVRGVRLDDYCNGHRLTTRQRVHLFIDVCDAVQHAHQKGVIHRDLKPSNVIVAEDGGRGRPKVIDFGIAKATGQQLTEHTVVTHHGQALGTLAYMSPEQAERTQLDIDTRSDIYSLGVILYELLLGVVPLDPKDIGAPLFLAQLVSRDDTMPTLTRRLTSLSAEERATIARLRGTELRHLRREVRGDLQWIVHRAIEKDRTRRYDSASALAQDLGRFLDHEPVSAHPPSAVYRFRKFARRNAAAVVVAAVALLALSAAGVSVLTSRNRAVASEGVARAEAQRAEAVTDFLVELFGSADPAAQGRDVRVAAVLDRASEEASERFAEAPVSEGSVRLALGTTYQGLGLYDEAARELDRAIELLALVDDPGLPQALHERGRLAVTMGNLEEARRAQEEGLEARRRLDGERTVGVADDLNAIAVRHFYEGDLTQATTVLRDALSLYEELLSDDDQRVFTARSNLATFLHRAGSSEEAVPLYRAALAGQRESLGPDHIDVASNSGNLAITLQELGRMDEVEPLLLDALRINRVAYGDETDHVARALNNLGVYYRRVGRLDQAERALQEALAVNRAVYGDEHREIASNLQNLGLIAFDLGQLEAAAELHARALALNERLRQGSDATPTSRTSLGITYLRLGRLDEAEELLREARTEQVAVSGEDHFRVANIDAQLADVLRRRGAAAEAEPGMRAALEALERLVEGDHPTLVGVYRLAAELYDDLGDTERAAEYRARARSGTAPG